MPQAKSATHLLSPNTWGELSCACTPAKVRHDRWTTSVKIVRWWFARKIFATDLTNVQRIHIWVKNILWTLRRSPLTETLNTCHQSVENEENVVQNVWGWNATVMPSVHSRTSSRTRVCVCERETNLYLRGQQNNQKLCFFLHKALGLSS